MFFIFDTIEIPFWFIVFVLASAAPIWIKWYKKFHKKFIVTGLLAKRLNKAKSVAEMKMEVFNKATNHWDENSELSGHSKIKFQKEKSQKKKLIR